MSKIFNRVLTAKNQGLPEDRQANARENIGVYSKDEIDQLIGEFGGFKIAPSDAEGHPDVSDKNPKIIYLVQVDGATEPDLYREWIWATDEETGVYDWVCIGDTSADLSDMARKSEMSVTESGDRTTVQLADGISATVLNKHQDISGKADKATTESAIAELQERFRGASDVTASSGISVNMHEGILYFQHAIQLASETATEDPDNPNEYLVTAELNTYTAITVPSGATKLTVNVPSGTFGILREAAFQFNVNAGNNFTFDVKCDGTRLKRIAPPSLKEGSSYQGTVVNDLCTLSEFDAVD